MSFTLRVDIYESDCANEQSCEAFLKEEQHVFTEQGGEERRDKKMAAVQNSSRTHQALFDF